VGDLLRYLFGPGDQGEHDDPRLDDLSELVNRAGGTDEAAAEAARELSRRGPVALPPILEALDNPFRRPGQLETALAGIYAAAPADVLRDGLHAEPFAAFKAAAQAARIRPDAETLGFLLDFVRDDEQTPTARSVVAEVLGDRGDPAAADTLREILPGSQELNKAEDDPPRLSIACVVALAKLGDFAPGALLVGLLADPFERGCWWRSAAG
jgi:HEAT repeat protein